ncbi:SRPBCC domain-containing protein [Streptomyces sp. NPDC006879]|uniref:SRPBCC family protein n=1 Tax=Streptomyces sp. NPDC006879 TaxID=3364767 RepID=UPI0036B90167
MRGIAKLVGGAALVGAAAAGGGLGLVTGAFTVDVGAGRRTRALGPTEVLIEAPRELVFDVIAEPYLARPTRALREKVQVWERGADMVLAAHFTPLAGGRVRALTVETVRFERPARVEFRLVRGPVPSVVESFVLTPHRGGTRLRYEGALSTDLWSLGQAWGDLVSRRWEATVAASLASVRVEAARRAARA